MRAKFIFEKFSEESDPIKDLGIGPIYHYFDVRKTNKNYYFKERGPKYVRDGKPTTYIYSIEKGNVYRSHPSQWSYQELRSNSKAFNKGNPDKMAIPNDVDKAKEFVYNHYMRLRKKAGLKESLNEKFAEEGDPVSDMGIGIRDVIEKYKAKVGRRIRDDADVINSVIADIQPASWSNEKIPTDEEYKLLKAMIEFLVKQNPKVNESGFYGVQYALNIQDPKRRREILKLVLSTGVKIKTMEDWVVRSVDSTANPDLDVTKELILIAEVGYAQRKEKFKSIFLNNVLKWAAGGKNMGLCKWALDKGADPSVNSWSPLQNALEHNQTELVKMLIPYLVKDPKFK